MIGWRRGALGDQLVQAADEGERVVDEIVTSLRVRESSGPPCVLGTGMHRNFSIDFIRNKVYNGCMITYTELQGNRRKFSALTGLTLAEFRLLYPPSLAFMGSCIPLIGPRQVDPGEGLLAGGAGGALHPPEQKLLFLLVYLRTYPLQVIMGELFGLTQPAVNSSIHRLLPVLRAALDDLGVLPEREPRRFARSQPPAPKLIIDGTERRRQRPKDPEKQAAH